MKTFCLKIALILGFALCIVPLQAQKIKYTTLKPSQFKAQMEQTENPCIIDIRSVADFEAGHIAGAVRLDPTALGFVSELKRLADPSEPVFVYCKLGKTSKETANAMVSRGFQNVFMLKGGFFAWIKLYPVVTE